MCFVFDERRRAAPRRKTRTLEQMERKNAGLVRCYDARRRWPVPYRGRRFHALAGTPRYPSRFLLDIDPECLMFSQQTRPNGASRLRAAYAANDQWIVGMSADVQSAAGDRVTACRVRRRRRRGNRHAEARLHRALYGPRYHPRHQLPREAGKHRRCVPLIVNVLIL